MSEKKKALIIGPCRLSYAHLVTPTEIEPGAGLKFNVQLLIPKTDKALVQKIKTAIEDAKKAALAANMWGGKVPVKFKNPLRDGDAEDDKKGDPAYKGMYFMGANSTNRPQVIDKDKNEILDKSEIYSGMHALVSVNLFAYDKAGNKGIGCGLNNVMKLKDGPKFSSQTTAEEDFEDVDADSFEIIDDEPDTQEDDMSYLD